MGYEIRDVDSAIKSRVTNKNFTVHMEGMDVRVQTLFSTPDELLAKKQIPSINIESGFTVDTPENWSTSLLSFTINTTDIQKADRVTDDVIMLDYGYKIGFYVNYKAHCAYFEREFLKLFPSSFVVALTVGTTAYYVPFRRIGIVNMDSFDEDNKIYRRDFLLKAQIVMEESLVDTDYRPFVGVTVATSIGTIY